MERQLQTSQDDPDPPESFARLRLRLAQQDGVSGREESHLPALSEPCLSLSTHTAPVVQPSGRTPSRQCANNFGSRLATRANHRLACRVWPRNRLYFLLAHRTRYSFMRLRSGYNLDL